MERVPGRNGDRKNLREQRGTGHTGDRAEGIDGALEFALRGRIDPPGHQGLNRGSGNAPQGDEGNNRKNGPAAGGEGESGKTEKSEKEAREKAAAFAKPFDDRSDEDAGNQRGADADERQREADIAAAPGVAILGVESPHGRKGIVSEVVESDDD